VIAVTNDVTARSQIGNKDLAAREKCGSSGVFTVLFAYRFEDFRSVTREYPTPGQVSM
jgi:hypothetical protein